MKSIIQVALPKPLWRYFDYVLPDDRDVDTAPVGSRVVVPFGRKRLIGVIMNHVKHSEMDQSKLKTAYEVLDEKPLLSTIDLALLQWVSEYYHAPLGEVIATALPNKLLQGEPAVIRDTAYYRLTETGSQALAQNQVKSVQQKALMRLMEQAKEGVTDSELALCGFSQRIINNILKKQWAYMTQGSQANQLSKESIQVDYDNKAELNDQQAQLVRAVNQTQDFQAFLVDGVTGSGKTEVYLQAMEQRIQAGEQALVLIPEIGLSPQTWQRFQQRFQTTVVVLHSQLPEQQRAQAWLKARYGQAKVVIGTRSALFAPMPYLGIIVVDEEHDASFKQQSGLRYNARDLALVRAKKATVPVILGTATPSLESLRNAHRQYYHYYQLSQRATGAAMPKYQVVDLRNQWVKAGLANSVLNAIHEHLSDKRQVLIFINRRGYAPTLYCAQCGWVAHCDNCDARMTVHQRAHRLCCHHCGLMRPVDHFCQACHSQQVMYLGAGTEKVEELLADYFQGFPLLRIDRDSVRSLKALEARLDVVYQGEPALLVGTQMLAKGHHFPNVTLVVIVNADQGLLSADFRGTERMAQVITQVAGRAGRVAQQGTVLIQTHQPKNPLLQQLVHYGYGPFAQTLLAERQVCQLPPYSHLALLRAESRMATMSYNFLLEAKNILANMIKPDVELLGPFPAPMERRAGRYRQQLFLSSASRASLQSSLSQAVPAMEKLKLASKVRWSVDKDPYDLF